MHQGDLDGIKGLYLINAVDEVTQFQFVCAVERFSERFLLPILEHLIQAFPFTVLSPYLNFHRPCFFPEEYLDAKGRLRKRYRYEAMMTPYDKLKSLPEASQFLRPGIRFADLDAQAHRFSDNEAARRPNAARDKLFRTINKALTPVA
ncbi:hypothetical protein AAE485_08605 [Acidithiobacillus ferriphilus]|uniref:hypothetical protein n=1 Tax=Acidithiobacillus ferriphilus TaxID=1689834 RepID=UPI00390CBDD1